MNDKTDLLRKQIYLTRDLGRRLHETARHCGGSESAIIREALEEYLSCAERRRTPKAENPVLQMAGMFEGGPECARVSENVGLHLAESRPEGEK